jgi:hypothetical protein
MLPVEPVSLAMVSARLGSFWVASVAFDLAGLAVLVVAPHAVLGPG